LNIIDALMPEVIPFLQVFRIQCVFRQRSDKLQNWNLYSLW